MIWHRVELQTYSTTCKADGPSGNKRVHHHLILAGNLGNLHDHGIQDDKIAAVALIGFLPVEGSPVIDAAGKGFSQVSPHGCPALHNPVDYSG